MLYKLMPLWFIDISVVLFCIGGIEGLQTCLVAFLSKWFKHAGESYVKFIAVNPLPRLVKIYLKLHS